MAVSKGTFVATGVLKQAAAFKADAVDVCFGLTCVVPLLFLKPEAQIVDFASETR